MVRTCLDYSCSDIRGMVEDELVSCFLDDVNSYIFALLSKPTYCFSLHPILISIDKSYWDFFMKLSNDTFNTLDSWTSRPLYEEIKPLLAHFFLFRHQLYIVFPCCLLFLRQLQLTIQ